MNSSYANGTVFILLCTVFTLGSCSSSSSGGSGITFQDFRAKASRLAGSNATDCGHADPDPDADIGDGIKGGEQNTCIGNAYLSQTAAFATYEYQGIDSMGAEALVITASSEVSRLSFDSDLTGGGSLSNGEILIFECLNPSLSGVVDGQPNEVFNCD
ncbi:hypothetical protein [Granulosicoccus antarcticus]|uniref:Lipoprotein n=1 Tax=Granulosicoccus antarcticus IMCC3135 TaxID=1192854 RepID=A0A2Z2P0Y9_9GAMM|nr:hypothetical protein [Granulosicoccus antarcticus]ASJ73947.1 hypothetical protein IMCC3135_19340 [Granulosicoccus antarcticus IMCC3135]